ncbi:hypothetical protein THAOC_25205, partial [Thalassiosira oceanica]
MVGQFRASSEPVPSQFRAERCRLTWPSAAGLDGWADGARAVPSRVAERSPVQIGNGEARMEHYSIYSSHPRNPRSAE